MSMPCHSLKRRGFTLVEVMVVVAVMSTIGFVLLQIFTSSEVVMAEMTAGAEADARVLRTVDRLHQELEFADPDSIEASASTAPAISFARSANHSRIGPGSKPAAADPLSTAPDIGYLLKSTWNGKEKDSVIRANRPGFR